MHQLLYIMYEYLNNDDLHAEEFYKVYLEFISLPVNFHLYTVHGRWFMGKINMIHVISFDLLKLAINENSL